jgi:hypothetical protein
MRGERMKAQMSLEMIIGLLILVIVAAVVIRTFLTSMTAVEDFSKYKESTELKTFETTCKSYCREFATSGNLAYAVQFCTTRLWPEGTSNKFKKPGEVDKLGVNDKIPIIASMGGFSVCEDAIFCFHFYDCAEYTTITPEDCRKILCEYFAPFYRGPDNQINFDLLNKKVREIIKGKAKYEYGSCNLRGEINNWWSKFFMNPDGTGPCDGIVW